MRWITFFLSVAILVGCALPASAQSDAYRVEVSGPGGAPFDDICNGSDVLIGFNYISGSTLNTIAGVCQAQNNGVLVGANYGLTTRGKDPGSGGFLDAQFHAQGAPRCPTGEALGAMNVQLDKNNQVQQIEAICVELLPNQGLVQTPIYAQTGGDEVVRKHIQCSPGDLAVGLIGRSGTLIDGVGLQCATFHPPPPTNIVKVIKAVDVYDRPNPGNVPAKVVDGLDPTNTVLVYLLAVSPNNPGWYQVSWNGCPPQPNWVYSATDYASLDPASLATAIATVNGGH